MADLASVIKACESTPSWIGIQISNLRQVNHLGDTVLHTVCSWGDVSAVKTLVNAGADINAVGDAGCTPLFNAVLGGEYEVVKYLISAGAKVDIQNDFGCSIQDYAINIGADSRIVSALKKRK